MKSKEILSEEARGWVKAKLEDGYNFSGNAIILMLNAIEAAELEIEEKTGYIKIYEQNWKAICEEIKELKNKLADRSEKHFKEIEELNRELVICKNKIEIYKKSQGSGKMGT